VGQRLHLEAIEPDRSPVDDLLLERQRLLANDEPVAGRRVACPLGEPFQEVARHLPAPGPMSRHQAQALKSEQPLRKQVRIPTARRVERDGAPARLSRIGNLPVCWTNWRLGWRRERYEVAHREGLRAACVERDVVRAPLGRLDHCVER
jgi:hypothetical protein